MAPTAISRTQSLSTKKSSKKDNKEKTSIKEPNTRPTSTTSKKAEKSVPAKKTAEAPKLASSSRRKEENDDVGEESEEEEESDAYLHGFSSDEDSSDEEDESLEGPSDFDVQKLPTIAKDDATVKRKLEKAKRQPTADRGVIYIGRLPHGFFEDQLRGYFSQFGDVTRLRVSRNKKTGASKHRAFIEFDSSSVAQIVAETMDNYLLMGHILTCKVIPKDQVHPRLWVGANRKWRKVPMDRVVRVQQNKLRTAEEQQKATKRLLKRENERKRKLEAAGIQYDLDVVSYKKSKPVAV